MCRCLLLIYSFKNLSGNTLVLVFSNMCIIYNHKESEFALVNKDKFHTTLMFSIIHILINLISDASVTWWLLAETWWYCLMIVRFLIQIFHSKLCVWSRGIALYVVHLDVQHDIHIDHELINMKVQTRLSRCKKCVTLINLSSELNNSLICTPLLINRN